MNRIDSGLKLLVITLSMLLGGVASGVADDAWSEHEAVQWSQIVSDSGYKWGEGTGETVDEARERAVGDLLSRIQISIAVTNRSTTRDRESTDSYEYDRDYVREQSSFTSMYLKGLEHIVRVDGDKYRALAYISKKKLKESFDTRRNQILDYARLGSAAEDEYRLGDALKFYYWGYLLALTYPDSIGVGFGEAPRGSHAAIALRERIASMIRGISTEAVNVYRDDDVVIAEIGFEYDSHPIENLSFSYYSGLAMDYESVNRGRAVIPIYDKPVNAERQLILTIDYASEGEMYVNDELWNLYEVLGRKELSNTTSVRLVFDWLLTEKDKARVKHKGEVRKPEVAAKREGVIPEPIVALSHMQQTKEFLRILSQYSRLGKLQFGSRQEVCGTETCYVAVVDEDKVLGLFSYDGKQYAELFTRKILRNLADEFKGKREIWMKEI